MKEACLQPLVLGLVPFAEARVVQNRMVRERQEGLRSDCILFCEHPPTLSLGKRTSERDVNTSPEYWSAQGVELVSADRGGGATYHGPGQLVIYPVVSLRERRLGVKAFVRCGLEAIVGVLADLGIKSFARYDDVGIWVRAGAGVKKIASAGLRIEQGITNHGFSLNVSGDYSIFRHFVPCGIPGLEVTSVTAELEHDDVDLYGIALELVQKLNSQLACEKAIGGTVGVVCNQ